MSENTKSFIINVKDLSFKSDQHVTDLVRYLAEALPQIDLIRNGNEINVEMSHNMSKRALKLRLKKFLYKKGLNKDFRPITYKSTDNKEGYAVKEKRIIDIDYY